MDDAASANPYAAPAAPLEPPPAPRALSAGGYRPLATLAQVLTLVMVLNAAQDAANIVHALSSISVMDQVIAGEEVPQAALEAIDLRTTVLARAALALLLAGAVMFCLVMTRANRNARSFGRMLLKFTPGWAAGYFFVPVVSLWKPYQAMKEIWRASEPYPDARLDPAFTEVPGLLPAWWAAFVLQAVAGQISARASQQINNAADYVRGAWIGIVASALGIVAALLAAAVVRALAARQDECQRQITHAASQPASSATT